MVTRSILPNMSIWWCYGCYALLLWACTFVFLRVMMKSLDPSTGSLGTRTHDLVPRNVSRRNTVACENPAVLTFMSNPFISISEASPPSKTQYPDLKYSADIGGGVDKRGVNYFRQQGYPTSWRLSGEKGVWTTRY